MNIHESRPFEPTGDTATPQEVVMNRRRWMKRAGLWGGAGVLAAGGYTWWASRFGSDDQVIAAGRLDAKLANPLLAHYPAERNGDFVYGRDETERAEAARYANFYEFTQFKTPWRLVGKFQPLPWRIEVSGLVRTPLTLDIDEFQNRFAKQMEERQYRHRCVETWAMAVPWTGLALRHVLAAVEPLSNARFVRFESFHRPDEAGNQRSSTFDWPYVEGLTLREAMNDLSFLAVGMYGEPLLKQHGAPIRLVVPWKYGFKSGKSIVKIELTDKRPATFWTTQNPLAYPFESNVDPDLPVPWPQHTEWMLGTKERLPTQKYNGYGEYVRSLYEVT